MNPTAAIFQDVGTVHIGKGKFIINRTPSEFQARPPGIQTLIDSGCVSWSALYNSSTRMNEAKELAVRNAVLGWQSLLEYKTTSGPSFDLSGVDDAINAIFSWVTDPTAEPLMMWVHDDDRTKTSFIAQVVANLLAKHRLLSATYFFDRDTDRGSLVPTLIHELTVKHKRDDLVIEISRVIEHNPVGVFSYNHRDQLTQLLVDPLKTVSESYQPDPQHRLQSGIIILHAFEDCNDEGGFQESFLHALLETLISIKATKYPQRLLVIGRRTDHLEEFLSGILALHPPILQRPVQSQLWLNRDQDMDQKAVKLERWEEEIRQSHLLVQDKEKMILRHKEECEVIKTLCSKKEWEMAEKEKSLQERESKVDLMSREVKHAKLRMQHQEKALQIRENEIKTKEEESKRTERIRPPTRIPSSPTSLGPQSPVIASPIQEIGVQEVGHMVSAKEVNRSDRVIILMGPLVPQKRDFIDCLTHCDNPWRLPPLTKTSDQFLDHELGNGRFWVQSVRTQRQSHTILFVDFPSLGNDDLAAAHILANIGTWLKEVREKGIAKIAGILYFHPLLESEMGPSHHNLRALGQICGNKAASKVIFVFEQPSSPMTKKAEAFFYLHYGNLMKGLGSAFAHFDNTAASGWGIVDRLLGPQSGDVSLFLQDELLVLKRSLHDTYAARQLYGDVTMRLKKSLRLGPRRSDSTDEHGKIQAELERLQNLLRRSRPSRERESEISATAVDFPDMDLHRVSL